MEGVDANAPMTLHGGVGVNTFCLYCCIYMVSVQLLYWLMYKFQGNQLILNLGWVIMCKQTFSLQKRILKFNIIELKI